MHRLTRLRSVVRALLTLTVLSACSDSSDPGIVVDLQMSEDHFHAWETSVTFTVLVTDGGTVISDFQSLAVEHAPAGTNTWYRLELAPQQGGAYTATGQFKTAGSVNLRVVGQRPTQPAEAVLHELTVSVVRPHWDVGGYRLEFDMSPGEPEAGSPLTLTFLLMEAGPGHGGSRPPITGKAVTIRALQGASDDSYTATESPPGSYVATHTFAAAGSATARAEFTSFTGTAVSQDVSLTVIP